MFNVFLPKLLETNPGANREADMPIIPKTLEESLWDVVIFTLGGCPGAIVRILIIICTRSLVPDGVLPARSLSG